MSTSLLQAIASGAPGAAGLERLESAERSMRMLLLGALLERVEQLPADAFGALAPPSAAWAMAVEAQRRSPSAVEATVADPFVRTWATRLLRRLEEELASEPADKDTRDPNEPPLWVEIGQFHCLAAALTVRAGSGPATLRLPTTRGHVWLPSLGVAGPMDDDPWGVAEVRVSADGIVLHGVGATAEMTWRGTGPVRRWQPLLDLRAASTTTGPLRLDAVTPYRDFGSVLLPASSVVEASDTWRTRLADATDLLERSHPQAHRAFTTLVTSVVPLPTPSTDPMAVASASSQDAFGAVALSLPPDRTQAAAALAHESRHQQLNALLALVPLVSDPDPAVAAATASDPDNDGQAGEPVFFAPWRSDPRPALGLLHGTFAFAGVADFWRTHRWEAAGEQEAALAHFEFAVLREQVGEGARTLASAGRLTPPGETFVAALTDVVDSWQDEEVPDLPARLARRVCAGRRAMWRLRHLAPDDVTGRLLADAWRSGKVPAVQVRLLPRPRPELVRPDSRGALSRLFLSRPEVFAEDRRSARGETAAFMDVIAGESAEAERWFRDRIARRPEDSEAWVGWAATWEESERPPAARLLLERPELVAGLRRALPESGTDGPDPLALAGWLAESGTLLGAGSSGGPDRG
ncbi:HEXXH motif domain-containing protein [Streptomyces tauricus]|uniref:HEXXH motif domain-containing protein n=1 Tax=Streptomyces tauricus TaxID=68274 RepID=UPI0022441678|nr:HEXXH motif domain-containing protein [Streptomyces tauricus]MCW8102757.1 HEXXH motif domain-containing protein [Streptomyces tauricus]